LHPPVPVAQTAAAFRPSWTRLQAVILTARSTALRLMLVSIFSSVSFFKGFERFYTVLVKLFIVFGLL
jgi:hypothetical protein